VRCEGRHGPHLPADDGRRAAGRGLRRRHPKLLWIAGGHEHTCMYSQEPVLVTKGAANAVRVWRFEFDRGGKGALVLRAEMIPLTEAYETSGEYDANVWAPTGGATRSPVGGT